MSGRCLNSGQTSQLMFARTFSDLINCSIHTVMEHLSDFLRGKFHIDVSPDYLSVALPRGIPLLGHYTLLELVFLCDIVDGDLMAFREQRTLLLLRVCTTVRPLCCHLTVPAACTKVLYFFCPSYCLQLEVALWNEAS